MNTVKIKSRKKKLLDLSLNNTLLNVNITKEEQAILGIFLFNKFILWNDIDKNTDKIYEAVTRYLAINSEQEISFLHYLPKDLKELQEWQDAIDRLVSVSKANLDAHPNKHSLKIIRNSECPPDTNKLIGELPDKLSAIRTKTEYNLDLYNVINDFGNLENKLTGNYGLCHYGWVSMPYLEAIPMNNENDKN
jgi:hypothetical protein